MCVVHLESAPSIADCDRVVVTELKWKGQVEWTGIDWSVSVFALGQVGSDGDRKSYLSEAHAMGSRLVEDHILGREEHCQEQEELMPMSSTLKDQEVKELDYSPGRSGTSSATWVGTGVKKVNSSNKDASTT